MLSSFLLIAPAASTICFAQSAPQEAAAGTKAKAARAQTVRDADPYESSADSQADAADAAPIDAPNVLPGVTANTATDSAPDFSKDPHELDYEQDLFVRVSYGSKGNHGPAMLTRDEAKVMAEKMATENKAAATDANVAPAAEEKTE